MLVSVGGPATYCVTVNPPLSVALPPALVTVMSLAATTAFEAIAMFAVSCVELFNVQEFTVIPLPLKLHVVPVVKLLPVSVTLTVCPCIPVLGFAPVSVG